jgi:nicotinate phosphoribosyltransferase
MRSFLSQDLYKITMSQAVWRLFPNAWVKYHYKLRTKNVNLAPIKDRIDRKIHQLQGIGPTALEINFLRSLGYFDPSFLASLAHFKLNPDAYVKTSVDQGHFDLVIEGPWYDTIFFEVMLLQIISETYFEDHAREHPEVFEEGRQRLNEKIEHLLHIYDQYTDHYESLRDLEGGGELNPFCLMEFGTRRAFSESWQGEVVETLAQKLPREMFLGTSNVYWAQQLGLKPQGTMAHEYICAHGALYPLHEAQKQAFYNWNKVFQGKLGTALSDTFTFDQFLRDFDSGLANLFTGARHDSGDPFEWGHKLIEHYRTLGINTHTKVAVWSDNLDIELAEKLWKTFAPKIKTSFGIGTNLTNDMGLKPLSQVIKLTHVNNMPVIKISDEPEKVMCEDETYKAWALRLFTEILPNQS